MANKWQERVRDLQASGLTYAQIGELVGLAASTIGDIANDNIKSPGGDAALALFTLHASRCCKSLSKAV